MEWREIYRLLSGMFDQDACLEEVKAIWENDRWFSRDRFNLTAKYCAEAMKSAGLDVEMLPLKADGKTKYFDWTMYPGWDVDHAILSYADGEVISDYHKMPCCLMMYSPSTPTGGVEAQVILPQKEDLEKINGSQQQIAQCCERYSGKILFATEDIGGWVNLAQKSGALGVIADVTWLYPGIRNSREELYDECIWNIMDQKATVFGIQVTPRQGDELRRRMALGPVKVKVDIQTRRYDGISYTIAGCLEGTEPQLPALMIYGHLYEPGANDNASGSGAIVYLAKLFGNAVRKGELPRPRRSIYFVVGDECNGSMGYLASHPEKEFLCAIVTDMIGTEKGDNATLSLGYDPVSNWSFADAALYTLAQVARKESGDFPSLVTSIGAGTDIIMADPCFGMPTVALMASPALSYHSSMDRPDRIEKTTLGRNALIAAAYLWGFANVSDKDEDFLNSLKEQIDRQIKEQMEGAHPRKQKQLLKARERAWFSMKRLSIAKTKEDEMLIEKDGIADFLGEDWTGQERSDELPEEMAATIPAYAAKTGSRIPKRLVKGTLTLSGEYHDRVFHTAWNGNYMIITSWADGKRNLWEIAYQSAVEKNKCSDEEIREEFELVSDFFLFLEQKGYVTWL